MPLLWGRKNLNRTKQDQFAVPVEASYRNYRNINDFEPWRWTNPSLKDGLVSQVGRLF